MGIETGIAAILGGLGIGMQVNQQSKALDAQKAATAEATKQAKITADAATEASNRANQKKPDSMAILASAQGMAKGGAAGTMLTGPSGVDPAALQLGKTTLLGA